MTKKRSSDESLITFSDILPVTAMPVCPRCGKVISLQKWSRHKARCGKKKTISKPITDENVALAGF